MLKLSRKNAQALYTMVQSLFWVTYGLMFAFASVYLQGRGFSNSGIGIVLGCSYAVSTFLQPMIANLFARRNIRTERGMCGIYAIAMLLSIVLLLVPLGDPAVALVIVAVFSLESALQPSVDTLARRWTNMGYPVNYGASRGFGSLVYAGMTAGMGMVLQKVSPMMIPAFYLGTMAVTTAILCLIRVPAFTDEKNEAARVLTWKKLLERPMFMLFLAGISCLSLGHVVVDNFMLQVMQNVGGNSSHLGIAISIASLVEFPAMLLYNPLSKRFGARKLLVFSAWAWLVKNMVIFFARSPGAVYAAEVLQFCSYGIYIPASIEYISRVFSARDNLKGQSFAGSAYTIGSVIATFLGGMLMDMLGVFTTLGIVAFITLLGAVLFSVSVRRKNI